MCMRVQCICCVWHGSDCDSDLNCHYAQRAFSYTYLSVGTVYKYVNCNVILVSTVEPSNPGTVGTHQKVS